MGSMVETPSSAQIPYYQLEPNGSIMSYVIPTLLVTGTIIFMEWFAAWSHEHIMHGLGWAWHKSHHEPQDESLEKTISMEWSSQHFQFSCFGLARAISCPSGG